MADFVRPALRREVTQRAGYRCEYCLMPEADSWRQHFRLNGAVIEPLTEIGDATVRILRFNAPDRVLQRWVLQQVKLYPEG